MANTTGYGYGDCEQSHGIIGILWEFLNSEIQWKHFKHGVNVIIHV